MIDMLKKMLKLGAPSAGWLVCAKGCGFKLHISKEEAPQYIDNGFPMHCGETVTFEPGRAVVNLKDEKPEKPEPAADDAPPVVEDVPKKKKKKS